MKQVLTIDNWWPTALNRLLRKHKHDRSNALYDDAEIVAGEAMAQGLMKANGQRRVSLLIRFVKGDTPVDPDAFWKSTLDALKKCGQLKDDNRHWVELGGVSYEETAKRGLVITLEDLPVAEEAREQRCENCLWWNRDRGGGNTGECRRHPPIYGKGAATFPTSFAETWCGEHQRPPQKQTYEKK